MASGTLVGQLILALATPLLSRLYSSADFGVFSLVLAVASLVSPAATLKLELALIIPREIDTARRLLRLGLLSSMTVSAGAALVVWSLSEFGLWTQLAAIPLAPLWVGAISLATAAFAVLSQAALRERHYSVVAKRSVIQASGTTAGQLGFSLLHVGSIGLLGGYLLGRTIGYVPLYRASRELFHRPSAGTYRATLREYWRFPLLFTSSGLLNVLGSQLPILLIAAWFGAANAGELGMAQRLVFIPVSLVGASIGQVFGAELAKTIRDGGSEGRRMYLSLTARMALVSAALGLALALIAPWLLPLILGDAWAQSGYYAQAMSVSVSLGLIVTPLSKVFAIYQASLLSVAVDSSRILLIGLASLLIVQSSLDPIEATWALYSAQAINYVITWIVGFKITSSMSDSAGGHL